MTPLPPPLAREAADRFDAWRKAAGSGDIDISGPLRREAEMRRVFAFSDFVARTCVRRPELPGELLAGGDLDRDTAAGDLVGQVEARIVPSPAGDLHQRLRRIRRREMVRIAWRDLAGTAGLDATLRDLSDLADGCIRSAVKVLYRRLCRTRGGPRDRSGDPQHLVVLAMGKLGARELNFSSDIDLIFAYPENGDTDAGGDSGQFFLTLCRQLISVLGDRTAEGFVYRVDTRLRPYGDGGPLAMSFDATESYYQEQGREWERYALIKARAVGSDPAAGAKLLSRLHPFVYRRYLDYGAFESLRGMKEKITIELRRRGRHGDVKLGRGGIREVEFFGQMFQLLRGGVTPALRRPEIRPVLAHLAAAEHVPAAVIEELQAAYAFLRVTENRLQQYDDQQVHRLPLDDHDRLRLAVSMGFPDWEGMAAELETHRTRVHRHFSRLLEPEAPPSAAGAGRGAENDSVAVWAGILDENRGREILDRMGYRDPEAALRELADLRGAPATRALSAVGRERLDRLVPRLLHAAAEARRPDPVLRRTLTLIKTIEQRTTYLALLLENPDALRHLLRLIGASRWIATFLARHPVLLDELLDPRTLYRPPDRDELEADVRKRLKAADADDLEEQIQRLCIFCQVNTLRVAAADVSGAIALMRTSDYLTAIAEMVLDRVLALCWEHLFRRHGRPSAGPAGGSGPGGFAVVAYGKLGGIELGYGSDLDLVFLHAADDQPTDGPRPLESPLFFARLGQRVVHLLTTHTRAGRLYEVDMRLRPNGNAGMLVSHVYGFEQYQEHDAWTWEHQALVRARPIAGDRALVARFEKFRRRVLARRRDPVELRAEVTRMRERMRREKGREDDGLFDLKQGPGGIVDIEFLVQYLVLRHAHRYPDLLAWTDNVRQLESLTQAGVLDGRSANRLKQAYLSYRSAVHRASLQERPAVAEAAKYEDLRAEVARLWAAHLGEGREGRTRDDHP